MSDQEFRTERLEEVFSGDFEWRLYDHDDRRYSYIVNILHGKNREIWTTNIPTPRRSFGQLSDPELFEEHRRAVYIRKNSITRVFVTPLPDTLRFKEEINSADELESIKAGYSAIFFQQKEVGVKTFIIDQKEFHEVLWTQRLGAVTIGSEDFMTISQKADDLQPYKSRTYVTEYDAEQNAVSSLLSTLREKADAASKLRESIMKKAISVRI